MQTRMRESTDGWVELYEPHYDDYGDAIQIFQYPEVLQTLVDAGEWMDGDDGFEMKSTGDKGLVIRCPAYIARKLKSKWNLEIR